MTIIRTGATQKYVNGWEQAFGKTGKKAPSAKPAAKSVEKKSAAKKSAAKSKAKSPAQAPAPLKKKKQPTRPAKKAVRSK